VGGSLFVSCQDMLDCRIQERIVKRADGRTRVAEDCLYLFRFQCPYHGLSAADHPVLPPFNMPSADFSISQPGDCQVLASMECFVSSLYQK
jgi:hypothetical protein